MRRMGILAFSVAAALAWLGPSLALAQQNPRGDFGAKLITVTPEIAKERNLPVPFGALVTDVAQGGAAAKADIAVGDLIQAINDRPALRAEDVQAVIDQLAPGAEIRFSLLRSGQAVQAKVTLLAPHAAPTAVVTGDPMLMLDTGGHMDLIMSLAFTRDGKQIVSGSNDKVVRVWDLQRGTTVRTIRGQVGLGAEGRVSAMALSPDNRWLAVAGFMSPGFGVRDQDVGDIRLYDFASGRLVQLLKGHGNAVLSLAFSPDSRRLISGGGDNIAILWDIESRQLLYRLTGHATHLYAVGFSPDGERAITSSLDHTLRLWRTSDGSLIKVMEGHSNGVRRIAVRRSDGLIASGDDSGEIRLWDGRTGQALRALAKQARGIGTLAFSHDGSKLLSTSSDYGSGPAFGKVWNVTTGKELVTYLGHDNTVIAGAISPDDRLAATGGGNSFPIHLWELATGQEANGPDGRPLALSGTSATMWVVGFSKDGKRMAWGSHWKSLPGTSGRSTENGSPLEFQLSLPSAGESLGAPTPVTASGAVDFVRGDAVNGNLRLSDRLGGDYNYNATLDIRRGEKVIASLERNASDGYRHDTYTFAANGRTVISGGMSGQLSSYDIAEVEAAAAANGGVLKDANLRRVAHGFVGHQGDVWSVAPSPDGRYLVSGGSDQTVRLWNLRTHELILTLLHSPQGEWAIWMPQGYYAASPGGEKLVGWNLNRGSEHEAGWVAAEQLRGIFYRPDLVAKAIALASAEAALKEAGLSLTAVEALKRGAPPVIRNVMWPGGKPASGGKGIITVTVRRGGTPPTSWDFKIGDAFDKAVPDVTVTARRVPTPNGHPPVAADEDLYAFEIPLRQGQNVVKFFAKSENGDSDKWEYPIFHQGAGDLDQQGILHVLAIGVDKYPDAAPLTDLRFAGRDALEFSRAATKEMKGRSKDVDVQTLCQIDGCSAQPTRANILAALEKIANSDARDTVVIFLAGHGESAGGKYFFLPTDFKRAGPDASMGANGLDWSLLEDAIGRARGSKFLFVDACHSGASFNASLLNDARQRSVIAFSSAGANQLAWEDPETKHGLFTNWVIKGLTGDADESDHTVKVYGLGAFLARKVPESTERLRVARQDPEFVTLSNPTMAWH